MACARHSRAEKSQEANRAELQQQSSENHGAGRRRLDVGFRQSNVTGKQRHFHAEAGSQSQPKQRASQVRESAAGAAQSGNAQAAAIGSDQQHRAENRQRAGQRVRE